METSHLSERWLLENHGGPCTDVQQHPPASADGPRVVSYLFPEPPLVEPEWHRLLKLPVSREEMARFVPVPQDVSVPFAHPPHSALVRLVDDRRPRARHSVGTVLSGLSGLGLYAADEVQLASFAASWKSLVPDLKSVTGIIRVAAMGSRLRRQVGGHADDYCLVWSNDPTWDQPMRFYHADRPDLELGPDWDGRMFFYGVPARRHPRS